RPTLYIKNIVFHATNNILVSFNLASITTYLGQTGNAWFYKMPNHEFINFFGVHVRVTHHMWSWPHNRHSPKQHIKKLWQFIYTGFSYKFTHFRNTLIISGSLI